LLAYSYWDHLFCNWLCLHSASRPSCHQASPAESSLLPQIIQLLAHLNCVLHCVIMCPPFMWNVLQVLNQDDTPLLYSLVFGEGVVNDATSVVLFRAVQNFNFDAYTVLEALQVAGNFLYLFFTSTVFGVLVIHFLFTSHMCYDWSLLQCLTYLSWCHSEQWLLTMGLICTGI